MARRLQSSVDVDPMPSHGLFCGSGTLSTGIDVAAEPPCRSLLLAVLCDVEK